MKIATWNINSVRLRLDLVLGFLQKADIDVLCLQETKTQDEFFPVAALADAGWVHSVFRGEKSYNGVAIILAAGQVLWSTVCGQVKMIADTSVHVLTV